VPKGGGPLITLSAMVERSGDPNNGSGQKKKGPNTTAVQVNYLATLRSGNAWQNSENCMWRTFILRSQVSAATEQRQAKTRQNNANKHHSKKLLTQVQSPTSFITHKSKHTTSITTAVQ
jgi:hypothetical protein